MFENKNVKFFFIRFRGVFARSQLLSLMNWNELTQTSPTEYVGSAAIWACGDFSFFRISEQRTKIFKASFVVLVVRCFCCFLNVWICQQAASTLTLTRSLALWHTQAHARWATVCSVHTLTNQKDKTESNKCTMTTKVYVPSADVVCACDVCAHMCPHIKWNRKCI